MNEPQAQDNARPSGLPVAETTKNATYTPGPMAWQKFGDRWCLTGQYEMRPIVLSCDSRGMLRLRDSATDLLVEFRPDHPDAVLLASAANTVADRDWLQTSNDELRKQLYVSERQADALRNLLTRCYAALVEQAPQNYLRSSQAKNFNTDVRAALGMREEA